MLEFIQKWFHHTKFYKVVLPLLYDWSFWHLCEHICSLITRNLFSNLKSKYQTMASWFYSRIPRHIYSWVGMLLHNLHIHPARILADGIPHHTVCTLWVLPLEKKQERPIERQERNLIDPLWEHVTSWIGHWIQDQNIWGSIPPAGHAEECRATCHSILLFLPSSDGYLEDEDCVWVDQAACIFVWHVRCILPEEIIRSLKWCVLY